MMQKKYLVLGGGMIGSAVAHDLQGSGGAEVTVADLRPESLARIAERTGARVVRADLGDPAVVAKLVRPFDVVVGALPSAMGYLTLGAVIEAGKDYVDISFMPEDALDQDEKARARGVTAVVDCGVAPGISNMMVGYAASRFRARDSVLIYVGGLPVQRRWPFDYKAGFAPHDVIEEYTRPARFVEAGRVVVKEALSDPELIDFAGVGTLEAFNTDGLRTLLRTIDAPYMKEKTLRYPGHLELVRALRETGFFSKAAVEVGGRSVRPLDVTAAVLFPKWTFEEGEADLTVLRVVVAGRNGEVAEHYSWDLLDYFDPESGLRSMSRVTAFPAAIVARLVAGGRFRRPGVHAPEVLGATPGLLDAVLSELRARGVEVGGSLAAAPTAEAELAGAGRGRAD
jgi:saccharopine dehydrogenase-like NADP-dependent oxidoreductase